MSTLPEFVGTIHIFLGPYRGNPIALYLRQEETSCQISPTIYPWNRFIGTGETVNKAAADFDIKWKEGELAPEMYSGPHWEGGIKPEKPKPPPKPAAPPKPAPAESAKAETPDSVPQSTETTPATPAPAQKPETPDPPTSTNPPPKPSEPAAAETSAPSPSIDPAEAPSTQSTDPSKEKPAS